MFADLHIHSRFSRACSKDLNLDNLVKWATVKGLNLLGTGDFTHPMWIEEIREQLKDNGKGFYFHNSGFPFVITGEISLIYTDKGKGRRIHLVILVPSLEIADKINQYIDNKGLRRDYDGRPIFSITCKNFVKDIKEISSLIEVIPAHIWTPWFGMFGSKGGYNSFEDCFEEFAKDVHAIETGISSDPAMNWKIKDLDHKSIVSFSDAHSYWPWRLGREATIFHRTDSYEDLVRQIRENDFIGTIETDPSYGKYHWDGHRNCGFSCSPEETKELNGICPKCNSPLVIGVDYRVDELSGQPENFKPSSAKMYYTLLPLHEIISLYAGVSFNSKKVWGIYNLLIEKFEDEFNILLNVSKEDLTNIVDETLVSLILKNREGKIKVQPGFDGEYGKAILEDVKIEKQKTLF